MSAGGDEWQSVVLGEVADVKWGDTQTTKASYTEDGYIAFSASGPDGFMDHFDHEGPGIVLSAIGAQCGKTWYADGAWSCIKNTIYLKGKPGVANTRFLYYATSVPDYWPRRGAAQPFISQGDARRCRLLLPPLDTQRRIASILGAYDDLIEVNRRRVTVLEEMSRGLFEEWFVRFRFPGHESVPLVDTPDGPLPQGWSWGQAKDVIAFDPKTKIPKDGDKPFIPMGHLDTVTSLIAPPESRTGNSGAKFRNGDTLFARITPCLENGKTGLVRDLPGVNGVGFGSTEFIVMRGERSGPAFAYCLSRLPGFRDHARSSMSGATGRQRARTESVENYAMAVPASNDLLGRFESASWPMLELTGKLGSMNERLAASRDLLLPRLISGQLSVEAAERDLELAA